MVVQASYKKYKRGQRIANVETDFRSRMMFSENVVSDRYVNTLVNFDFTQDGRDALKPRAGLVTCEFIVPDMLTELDDNEDFLNDDVVIKYSKECVEHGEDYRQFILGKPDIVNGEIVSTGKIWALTSKKAVNDWEDVRTSAFDLASDSSSCAFYNTNLTEIHETKLVEDAKTAFPVGTFMGNSFYFFDGPEHGKLRKTEFSIDRYVFSDVPLRELTASEAVNYGYNMLASDPYVFMDKSTYDTFEMEGILPYDRQFGNTAGIDPELMMVPRANSRVWFRCNYNVTSAKNYRIVWSWKEVSADEWMVFHTEDSFNSTDTPVLQADLIVPAKEILIRCEAYNLADSNDAVEKAMTVGFDFTLDGHSTVLNTKQEVYDLSTASGMMSWKNRLVVWGLPEDPTILFISDIDEPGYFPYPNNISIFDEPIISVTELMDNLIVFTKNKVYQVTLDNDGVTWTSTVIQSNLYIEAWDKHLIQSVRNMLYFKSGNYYYMIVPKAQSITGELTLAPITTPITDFFNHFSANVAGIFKDCFKVHDEIGEVIYNVPEDLVTYYNFIDYENIHNFYVYRYKGKYVHFDIIYNVVDRYWKINIYESSHFLFPFRNDATQQGLFSSTSVMNVRDIETQEVTRRRTIQLFKFDPLTIEDIYIPAGTTFSYIANSEDSSVDSETIIAPSNFTSYDAENEVLTIDKEYVTLSKLPQEILSLVGAEDFIGGFNRREIKEELVNAVDLLKESTIFPNKQMLDTGYRDANFFINKRYRELQLHINNLDNVDMEFGMDFQISGEPRNTDFLYEVSQTIDELNQDEGIVYLDATPYLSIPWVVDDERKGDIDKVNRWVIDHSLYPDISLWKVRAAVSGKGTAPRLRLFTRNQFNYQLLGINWIYREMNMR